MFNRLKTIFKGRVSARTAEAPKSEPKADKGRPADAKAPAKKKRSPEEMCGITSKMGKDEVRAKLAVLYKRYNRATSSLDANLRAEAEEMLDAIVAIREKVFGPI